MTDEATSARTSRVRASERALKIAIKAMQNSGLQVRKLVVIGAAIEVHAGAPTEINTSPDASGPEDW